jgi:hypothetical protein
LAFRCLKYNNVGNFGLGHQGSLRICDFRVDHDKFADLRFVDQTTSEICGFAIAERAPEFADLQTKKICVPTFAREGCLSGHTYPPNPQSTGIGTQHKR